MVKGSKAFQKQISFENYPSFKCAHIDNFCKILYVTSMELKMDKSSGRTCVLLESQSLKPMICTMDLQIATDVPFKD